MPYPIAARVGLELPAFRRSLVDLEEGMAEGLEDGAVEEVVAGMACQPRARVQLEHLVVMHQTLLRRMSSFSVLG